MKGLIMLFLIFLGCSCTSEVNNLDSFENDEGGIEPFNLKDSLLLQSIDIDLDSIKKTCSSNDGNVLIYFTGFGNINGKKLEYIVHHDKELNKAISKYHTVALYMDNRKMINDSLSIGDRNSQIYDFYFPGEKVKFTLLILNKNGDKIVAIRSYLKDEVLEVLKRVP